MDAVAWRIGHELAEAPDRAAFLERSTMLLGEALGGDCFWMETDFAAAQADVWGPGATSPDPWLGRQLAAAVDHPAIQSYVADPSDLSPRRLSDVVGGAGWRRTQAFSALAAGLGRHQLSLVTRLEPPAVGHGWTLGRAHGDFPDAALDAAGQLLLVLHGLERRFARETPLRGQVPPDRALRDRLPGQRGPADSESFGLTRAEREVLQLLASGLTADGIGRRLGSSGRTVRKHLEHAYAKLGCHDRLVAVEVARRHGLLDPATGTLPRR